MEYFKSDGKFIYLDYQHAEFYIPKSYFENRFAEDLGNKINAFGIFEIGFFKDGKLKEMKVLNIPTWMEFTVIDSEDRNVNLQDGEAQTPCKILKYDKGHKVTNATVIEDSANAGTFLSFILKGKVPGIVPYGKTLQLWQKNQRLNKVNLGVPSVIEELVLSVTYRYKQDPAKKFCTVIGADPKGVSEYDYTMNNIRQICQNTSTFTAITFEDIDSMISSSLNRNKKKTYEAKSPLEDLIKL